MTKHVFVGVILDARGKVIATAESKTPQSLSAISTLFHVHLVTPSKDLDVQQHNLSSALHSALAVKEQAVTYDVQSPGQSGAMAHSEDPVSYGHAEVDKHDPNETDVLDGLRALSIRGPEAIMSLYGTYRCARVLRACAAKRGRIRHPCAWVLSALYKRWDVDED